MILVLGDSNYRNMIEVYGETLSSSVGDEVVFEFVSSVESLRLALTTREDTPSVVIIGSPLNEIATRINKNQKKGKDETVKTVIQEQVRTVALSAEANPTCLHLIMPPFIRQDPKWIEDKVSLALFYNKQEVTKAKACNLAVGSLVDITMEDLLDDKVHLNDSGKEKLYGIIESDISKCKEAANTEEDGNLTFSQDWASQMNNESIPPTSNTVRKRNRQRQDSEGSEMETDSVKRARVDEVLLDKLNSVLEKLDEHKSDTKANFLKIERTMETNKTDLVATKKRIDKIEKKLDKDDLHDAELREDIDGLENENLRSIVIVRKLPTAETVPVDKKSLSTFIQKAAKDLVIEVLGAEAKEEVKYVATLYSFIDPTKKDNRNGLIPPFKIGFRSKDVGIRFRETAVKKSKEAGNRLASTYFTHCQSSATRVRVMLLWSITDAIKSDKREVWVNQNANKPTLQVKEDGKVRTLTFSKAMEEYKDKIPKKTIDESTKIAKRYFAGQIKKTFIVLKD